MALTWQEILDRFYLQVDDSSQLSSVEALALANEIYTDIIYDRDWEWLKTTYSGTQSISVPYIALPSDFRTICPNYMASGGLNFGNAGVPVGWSWNDYSSNVSAASSSVVFVGSTFSPYSVIPFSQRRNYRTTSNLCYIDYSTNRLYFTVQPTAANAVEYDYIKVPTALTVSTSPLFQAWFHEIIAYWMAAKFDPMQQTDKAQSYQWINTQLYNSMLSSLRMLDANQKLQFS